MDFSKTDWAVVLATFASPIVAVLVTLWVQKRDATRQLRTGVFATLMRLRRQPTDREFVGSLNMVPVYFYMDKKVMDEYVLLSSIFESPFWRSPDGDTQARQHEQMRNRLAYLLSAMASSLGIKVDQLQILSGGYAPTGWYEEENINMAAQKALLDALTGNRPPVVLVHNMSWPGGGPSNDQPSEAGTPQSDAK